MPIRAHSASSSARSWIRGVGPSSSRWKTTRGFASGFDATGPSRVGRLVAFNVGVELAQLGWVALGWVALSLLGRPGAVWRRRAVLAVSVVAGSGATYACVLRALSP